MKTLSNSTKKTLSIVMMTWAIIMLSMVSKVQAQTTCVNSDFSLGDYTNWTGSYGWNLTGVYSPSTGMVIGAVNAGPYTLGQQTIITDPTLYDENTANALRETPPSGGYSCRLGNSECQSCDLALNPEGAEMDYHYTPTATSAIFTYQYAVVLQDPSGVGGHTPVQCPKFFIYVEDSTGTVVDSICGQYVVTASSGLPGFTACSPASDVCTISTGVVWKNWTTVAIDLSGHINKSMIIKFIALDCSLGGHFGYAYISCLCGSMSLTQQCFGTSDIISAPAGFASYSWSIGSGTAQNDTIHNAVTLNGDTVTCVCTSVTGCDVTLKIPIDIQPLILSASSHPVAICPGASSTLAVIDSTGGVGDTYNWSCGGTTSTVVVSPVVNTTYTVSVTSSSGCSGSIQTTVIIKPKPRATIAQDSVICHGGNTGSATVTPTSGTSPFTYLWTPTGQTAQTATGLNAGTYSVLITDSGGCDTTYSVTVLQPTALAANISASTNVSCSGGSNGTATVTQSGGTPTYTYSWSTTPSHQTTVTATGLSAGTYTVTVTDANGCIKTTSVIITQPTLLIANITPSTNVSCYGGSDGTATASPSGGTPSYLFIWSNGSSLQTATGLSIGTYTVTVTDANNCTQTATVTITQPTPVVASIIAFTDVKCYGGHTGTATVSVIGGTPGYQYYWNSSPAQVTSIATGLPAGTYTVTATDANLCTNTATVTISQPTDIVLSLIAYTNVSCFGYNNGSASVSATGGVPGYTYIWDDGETGQTADSLNPGVHSVTVMDANNCTKTTTVTITQPPQINMTEVTDSVLCYGQANGSITVTATGGTLPYASYIWNTGQSGSVASNLHVGTYTCTVTDANGCKDSIRAHVLQPLILTSIVINADTILPCYGLNNGTITIYVVGGTAPFTYYWNTGATGMTINNLSGGTYTDTITDHNGCRNIHTVVVTQPPALFVQIDSIPESCLNSCDGQLTSAVTGGTPFLGAGGSPYYHYLWNTTPPQTTESITGLCEGTYNLTITDSNGCQRIISNYLGVNDSVVAGFSAAPTSGYIPLTVNFLYTGTSSPANNYTWNFGDGTISSLENPTHIYTTADTFSVWLYITNGICKDSIHIFVYPEIPSLLIVPNVFTPNGDGYNDEFMVKYQNIKTFSCVIFDRWGKKMYEWDDVTKGWDGKTKGGADCADGTYFYILSAEGWDGIKYTDHGTVTLIRH